MKIGVLTNMYADMTLPDALDKIKGFGAEAVEFSAAGYGGTAHVDARLILKEESYGERVMDVVRSRGLELSALSVHGNPLHPNPEIAEEHDRAMRNGILAAAKIGIRTVNCFSGCPGDPSGGTTPNWVTCPWPPEFADLWKWQWEQVVIPYWTEIGNLADDHGIQLGFEMHPNMVVYNAETLLRLRASAGTAVGANFDPSHLIWQGVDVCRAIRVLAREQAIFHVHTKDTHVDAINIAQNGNIDPKPYEQVVDRAWSFRSVGYGSGEQFWKDFVSELRIGGFDGVLSIEHEDMLASRDQGLARAMEMLRRCVLTEPPSKPWWT